MPDTQIARAGPVPTLSPPPYAPRATALSAAGRANRAVDSPVQSRSAVAFAWTRQCLTATLAAGAAWTELGRQPHAALFDAFERLAGGASRHNLAFAVVALVIALAVLDIDTAGIASVLLSIVSASSVASLLEAGKDPLLPLVALVAASGTAWQRRVELCEFSRYLVGWRCERFHIVCPEDDLAQRRQRPLRDCGAFLD
jgi:hypothetical protein